VNDRFRRGKPLTEQRARLPAWGMREKVGAVIGANQVVVIKGATGCGKSTQVPQFILDGCGLRGADAGADGRAVNIICTQPRRISAIGVAERVAAERGEVIGGTVGYRIRLDAEASRATRLLFCTTGILLRMMQGDEEDDGSDGLEGVTHVVVDEVHERSLDTDFLLVLLRDLLPRRPDLRVVLMSATVNADLFAAYFGGCPTVEIPGFTFPVERHFLEEVVRRTGYTGEDPVDRMAASGYGGGGTGGGFGRMKADLKKKVRERNVYGDIDRLRVAGLDGYADEELFVVSNLEEYSDGTVPLDLVEATLEHIELSLEAGGEGVGTNAAGAVLVFLPGWDDISKLHAMLQAHRLFGNSDRFLVLPLHSSLPTAEQRAIFQHPPAGVRKIVLATNIAETSITIDDVVYVVDSGRYKEMSFDAATNVSCLLGQWVSKASAQQRSGRAGRVQKGVCFHLFSSVAHAEFPEYQAPEILRTPLEGLCLQVKSLGAGGRDVAQFLERALEPPDKRAVGAALSMLRVIGALEASREREELTTLGRHLCRLPVDPRLGKMLIYAVLFGCLDPCLTIASSLGFRNPFVMPMDKKEEADRAKVAFADGLASDHAAFLHAYDGWKRAGGSSMGRGGGASYARTHFLSQSTLTMIDEMRQQFLVRFAPSTLHSPPSVGRPGLAAGD
jgi:ATP-dependent RNA helicase DHX36